jgi:DNA repair photolyase
VVNSKELTDLRERLSERDLALFQGLSEPEAERFISYLFSVPKKADGVPNLRSQAIGLYDPFCDRRAYPLGILWQCAPYSFCNHGCAYCYGRSYLHQFGGGATVKKGFRRAFDRSLEAMKSLNLPLRHLSMANSTDVLQEKLEREHRHTLYMLQSLRTYRDLFSSFCILTKNPGILLDDPAYVAVVKDLGLEVQVSIAFWRDEMGKRLEPGAPLVSKRRRAVESLVSEGVPVALRMDPLFPRGVDGCTEYQSLEEDLGPLVSWAAQTGVSYVITSPLKLVFRRNTVSWFNQSVIKAFPVARGGYRRMPDALQQRLLADAKTLCQQYGLRLEHCFANILKRNAKFFTGGIGGA